MFRSCVVWLRNDLRFHDNESIHWAHENSKMVIPIFCFDPRQFETTHRYHFPKTGNFRAKFLLEAVTDLRKTLEAKGSGLLIFKDRPENVLPKLFEKNRFEALVFQKEVTKEETDVETACEEFCSKNKIRFQSVWGSTLYHKDDLPYIVKRLPDTFTDFRKSVENRCKVRIEKPMPDKLKSDPSIFSSSEPLPSYNDLGLAEPVTNPNTAFPFSGGETAALSRMNSYFWTSGAVSNYKSTRNGLLGSEYSTKFSPWLAFGCISPRHIFFEIKKFEKERVKNDSTYWVIFELLWRDYFRFVAEKYGNCLFFSGGIKKVKYKWDQDMEKFKKWADGQTGVPFVDANMRELQATGWMSNRGRQNVASFLTKDLKLDWRLGAEWFEYLLIDYDVCSNYGNWNYCAGVGNDPREDRKFNMIKQAMDYDPDGNYVRAWIPELASISGGKIHIPWTLRHGELPDPARYPKPMLIAQEWTRHFDKPKSSAASYRSGQKQKGIDFYFKSNSSSSSRR